mmetsp:Transcript_45947/g.135880  ORF Transcript_45947/g.135880 Transcript_45947/m.135880 type:complete len:158 (+) Transcript_45947:86-559(+)
MQVARGPDGFAQHAFGMQAAPLPGPAAGYGAGAAFTRRPERASLPAQQSAAGPAGPASEFLALRAEVARLLEDAKRDALEKEQLRRQVERLQAELRKTMEENRSLWASNEERKNVLAQATAKEEAAAKERSLDHARDLFRSMLSDDARPAGKVGTAW